MNGEPTALDLDHLNPEQLEAVRHFEGPILVLAGAGSGKTRVLTTRIAHLVRKHGVPPERIFAVTFTNKAAGEMRDRISGMLGGEPRGMWVGTFHSLGARMLRRDGERLGFARNFTIHDADQSLRLVKRIQTDLNIDPKRWNPKAIRGAISHAKNALVDPPEFAEMHGDGFDAFQRQVSKIYPEYQADLRRQDVLDFDDLLVEPVRMLRDHEDLRARWSERFPFVLVDEYQDTNRAQFELLELLAGDQSNLMVVGDDDQSIYGWRGADIANILDFERRWPGARVVRLERNYRSTSTILDAANAVIAENRMRKGKTLRTDREPGETITVIETADETDEARSILSELETEVASGDSGYSSFAVLYRTNAQARAIEDAFRRGGIPYQVVGGVRFYERREIQDLLGYLRLISNARDREAFDRVVNYPPRSIGAKSRAALAAWAAEEGLTLLEASGRAEEVPGVGPAAVRSLANFSDLIWRYSHRATEEPLGDLLGSLIEELRLLERLRDEGPDGDDRAENVRELVSSAADFEADRSDEEETEGFTELDLFLQQVALVAEVDRHDPNAESVTLMTLHNAKGLEFPVVFVTGLEDGLFPLSRSYDDPATLEEERRLFYVGLTRAERRLVLTWARQRRRGAEWLPGVRSPFLTPIPDSLLETRRSAALARRGGSAGSARFESRGRPIQLDGDDAFGDFHWDQDGPEFRLGERVSHGTFGGGAIKRVEGMGKDAKITVVFDSVGPKKLLVRYAGLSKED